MMPTLIKSNFNRQKNKVKNIYDGTLDNNLAMV
jgi:hypothetical protein